MKRMQSVESDSEMAQVIDLVGKDIKTNVTKQVLCATGSKWKYKHVEKSFSILLVLSGTSRDEKKKMSEIKKYSGLVYQKIWSCRREDNELEDTAVKLLNMKDGRKGAEYQWTVLQLQADESMCNSPRRRSMDRKCIWRNNDADISKFDVNYKPYNRYRYPRNSVNWKQKENERKLCKSTYFSYLKLELVYRTS